MGYVRGSASSRPARTTAPDGYDTLHYAAQRIAYKVEQLLHKAGKRFSRLVRVEMYFNVETDSYGIVLLDDDKTQLTHHVPLLRVDVLSAADMEAPLNTVAEQLVAILMLNSEAWEEKRG